MEKLSLIVLSIFLLIFGFGCSHSKNEVDEEDEMIKENENMADATKGDKSNFEDDDLLLDDEESSLKKGLRSKRKGNRKMASEEILSRQLEEDNLLGSSDHKMSDISLTDDFKGYKVKKNETLMLIAFKLYGDYRKWKDLKAWNTKKIQGSMKIPKGTLLQYKIPEHEFVWKPDGLPYLIKNGDTLGLISNKVYGTPKKWKPIWENNRPLIRDPNIIFAGFTLYYVEDKNLASF